MEISKIAVNGTLYAIKDTVTSINGKSGAIGASDIASVLTASGYKLTDTDTDTVTSINGKTGAIAASDIASVLIADGYKLTNTDTTYQFSQSGNTLQMGTNGGTKSDIYTPTGIFDSKTVAMNSAGLPTIGGSGLAANTLGVGRNGIAISATDTNNDGAAIYMENITSEKNNLVIALGDDGSDDQDYIKFRYINTSGAVTNEITIPKTSGTLALTSQIPSSIPANGGNSTTVNGHTVNSDVPANALFTDTTYSAGTGLSLSGTTFNVSYGTTAGTACQGNDSRLSDSRPASDVSAWAKASTKPTYITSEVMSISKVAISSNTSSSCSITGSDNAGKAQTIIYTNSGSADYTVTVPTTYSTPDGAAIELTCKADGYCEVSYLNIGGTIYARGL